jgi:hypothetical protein
MADGSSLTTDADHVGRPAPAVLAGRRGGAGHPARRSAVIDREEGRVRAGHGAAKEVDVADHPVLGYVIWAVLFGALFAWEGLALSHLSSIPTLSDCFRAIMRYPVGRWALFALWLWFGWHIFVRGWHFLLRA